MMTLNTEANTTDTNKSEASSVAKALLDAVNAKAKKANRAERRAAAKAMAKASKEAAQVASEVAPAAPAPVQEVKSPEVPVQLTASTRDYASMRRFIKKYGRSAVEGALREVAKEVSGRRIFAPTDVITLLKAENPHARGTKNWKRWNKYRNGMTVAEAVKAGIERANIRYLNSINYIAVSGG